MFVKDIIRNNRLKLGLTMKELADKVGVSEATISRWESGEISNMKHKGIIELAKALRISPLDIMGWSYEKLPSRTVSIPILGHVPAGTPIEAIEDVLGEVEIDESLAARGEYFALQIRGESMAPKIENGDVVIVRKQKTIESGEVAIVYVNGYEATCKKVLLTESSIILQPINASYPAQSFSWEEAADMPVCIVGKVIESRRFF